MSLAVLDLGSNTFHLLVTQLEEGELARIGSRKHVVRLLEDGRIGEAGWRRAIDAVDDLVAYARAVHAARVVVVATSAIRDSDNGAALARLIEDRHEVAVEVLSGDDEARLSYQGARRGVAWVRGRAAVIDVGGGSVEVAVGDDDRCTMTRSLPLGHLRLRDALQLPLGRMSIRDIRAISERVSDLAAPVVRATKKAAPHTIVFSSGTARALGKLAAARRLTHRELVSLATELSQLSPPEIVAMGVAPARAETIATGALVIACLTTLLDAEEIVISPWALREGVALREHRRAGRPLRPRPAADLVLHGG